MGKTTLRAYGESSRERVEVTAYESSTDGLVVHRWVHGPGWAVAHVSGLRVDRNRWRTRAAALQVAEAFGELTDWTREPDEVRDTPALTSRINKVVKRFGEDRLPMQPREPQEPTKTGVSYEEGYDEARRSARRS